jgi:hypothetical protein
VNVEETKTIELRVVFLQEGDRWIAQGVDYDICASGRDLAEAQHEFDWAFVGALVVRGELGMLDLSNITKSLPRAPEKYRTWFKEAQKHLEPSDPFPVPPGLPGAHVIGAIRANERREWH